MYSSSVARMTSNSFWTTATSTWRPSLLRDMLDPLGMGFGWNDAGIRVDCHFNNQFTSPLFFVHRHRVDEWVKQLDLFGRTLDEWLTCQRNWLYLEVGPFVKDKPPKSIAWLIGRLIDCFHANWFYFPHCRVFSALPTFSANSRRRQKCLWRLINHGRISWEKCTKSP